MQLLPYIAISKLGHSAAPCANADDFTWFAVASEALDGFVPDLGPTNNYVYPSVYRPPSVVTVGVPSQVRHRF